MDQLLLTLILIVISLIISISSLIITIRLNSKLRKITIVCKAYSNLGKKVVESKVRKRYIVFKIIAEDKFSKNTVWESIKSFIVNNVGEIGFVNANPELIYFDEDIQTGVLRITHRYSKFVAGLINLIKEINGKKCLIIPVKITGTLRKAKKTMYALTERKIG